MPPDFIGNIGGPLGPSFAVPADPNLMLMTEMLKTMKSMRKNKGRSDSDSDKSTGGNGVKGVGRIRRRLRKQHKILYFDRLSLGAHIECNILLASALENTIKPTLMFPSETLHCFGLCFVFSLCEHARNHS